MYKNKTRIENKTTNIDVEVKVICGTCQIRVNIDRAINQLFNNGLTLSRAVEARLMTQMSIPN